MPRAKMKSLAFSVCIFLNVMLFGICGYMYLLWLTYWHRMWNQKQEQRSDYDISDFRRNEPVVDYYDDPSIPSTGRQKTQIKTDKEKKSLLSFLHKDMYPGEIAASRLHMLKTKTIAKLRQAMLDQSNTINTDIDNPYGVQHKVFNLDHENLLCDFYSKAKYVETLKKSDDLGLINEYLPEEDLFSYRIYNNCAVVSSAGSLRYSNLGSFIDNNDLVLRFNNAPYRGYENDVGSKTTIRILNSQVLSESKFQFQTSNLYKNINLLVWDPSNYSSSLQQWIKNPEHNFIEPYITFRTANPKSNFHILNPSSIWLLWDFIQGHTTNKIKPNPPSSGFIGIALLLPHCSNVNIMEYVPSERVTTRCHYYSQKSDPLCTYGVWHPLAAEKLIALSMNTAPDNTVFNKGYISIPGYNRIFC